MREIEHRLTLPAAGLSVEQDAKGAAGGGSTLLRGYAAVFDSLSQDLGGFFELIRKGAFKKTIETGDARGLWNHEAKYVLGRKSAGTLKLWEDGKGLAFSIRPPDTQWAVDLMTSVARKDISQMSFGFFVDPNNGDTWSRRDGKSVRELLSVTLLEISIVSWPAYTQTEVHVREEAEAPEAVRAELNRRRKRLEALVP
ncbi:MAG: HK97 family phage prohead protease [Nitrospirales bacterium]